LPAQNGQPQPPARQLQENTVLHAVVMAKTSNDHVVLHTELGNFRITTPLQFPIGSHITFEITQHQDVVMARLIAFNGREISPPLEVRLLPIIDKPPLTAEGYVRAGQLNPAQVATDRPVLSSLALRLAPSTTPPLPSSPEVPSAASAPPATVAIRTLPPLPDGFEMPPGNVGTTHSHGFAAYQRSYNPAPTAGGGVHPPLSPPRPGGAQSHPLQHLVRAEILSPPGMTTGRPQEAAHPAGTEKFNIIIRPQTAGTPLSPREGIYQGSVIAIARAAEPTVFARVTLQTPLGTLAFNSKTPPSIGTTMQFAPANEITAFPLPEGDLRIAGSKAPQQPLMADWPNLREALNHLARTDPIIAQNVISQAIPQANAQLSNSLLFFIVALSLGSIDKWLGQEFTSALRGSGRGALLQALDDDFKSLGRLQGETGGQDWKSLNFPFFDGANLRQMRMFYRRHGTPENEGQPETTRFVIELNLTRSGQMQLDGLFKAHQFNLAIRSHSDLSDAMRMEISRLFTEHMDISGLKGHLTFRTSPAFPLDPLAEWEEGTAAPST
jgi:hypothetical protein